MLRAVSSIRRALRNVPDAFYDLPPEDVRRGSDDAVEEELYLTGEPDSAPIGEELMISNGLDVESDGPAVELDQLFEFGASIDLDRLKAALGEGEGERIKKSVEINGIDALGWYVPFHVQGGQWGIYISVSGIAHLMIEAFGSLNVDWQTVFRLSFRAIHQHELFHFAVDYFAGQWELLHGRPCHKPARALRDTELGYNILEEKSANNYMIRRVRAGGKGQNVAKKTSLLRDYIKTQPRGYRDGYDTALTPFLEQVSSLLQSYATESQTYDEFRHADVNLVQLLPGFPVVDWQLCPVHFINDGSRLNIPQDLVRFVSRISVNIEESRKFQKQLSQLPKRVFKEWDLVKYRLRYSTLDNGLDFKPWKPDGPGVYSVRVSRKYRAHLYHDKKDNRWTAIKVGDHDAMGH